MNKIEELNFWVSGLEEVLGEDWHPNIDQWKVVRAKIKELATQIQPSNDSVLFRTSFSDSRTPPYPGSVKNDDR